MEDDGEDLRIITTITMIEDKARQEVVEEAIQTQSTINLKLNVIIVKSLAIMLLST